MKSWIYLSILVLAVTGYASALHGCGTFNGPDTRGSTPPSIEIPVGN